MDVGGKKFESRDGHGDWDIGEGNALDFSENAVEHRVHFFSGMDASGHITHPNSFRTAAKPGSGAGKTRLKESVDSSMSAIVANISRSVPGSWSCW